MCNLTLVQAPTKEQIIPIIYELGVESSTLNSHGWGVFQPTLTWRTALQASIVSNAGIRLREVIKNDRPVLGHTRSASPKVAVEIKNVHPFSFSHLIGAHNGTLVSERFGDLSHTETTTNAAGVQITTEVRESDSHKFFELLNTEIESGKDMVTALTDLMKDCRGKFAFIIYSRDEDCFYVVRGKSADLHICTVLDDESKLPIGLIVNTVKNVLVDSANRITNLYQLLGMSPVSFSPVIPLKQETIFKLDEKSVTLVEVGTITENPLERPKEDVSGKGTTGTITKSGTAVDTKHPDKVASGGATDKPFREITDWALDELLTPTQVNDIFIRFMDKPLPAATEEDLGVFVSRVIPRLTSNTEVNNYITKMFIYYLPVAFYVKNNINFPIALNKPARVIRALREWTKKEQV